MKKLLTFLVLLLCSTQAFSANIKVTGKVASLKVFSDRLYIYMDNISGACGTSHHRVVIDTSSPIYSTVVSTAMAAKVSNADVELAYKDQCTVIGNAWDFHHLWLL